MAVYGHLELARMPLINSKSASASVQQAKLKSNNRKYIEITKEYTLEAAKAFSTLHPNSPFTFVFVSGEGATQTPGMFTALYGKVKGQTEVDLIRFHEDHTQFMVYNVRPGVVDWRHHPEIHNYVPSLPAYRSALMPALDWYKSMMTPTRPMSKIMTELAMSNGAPLTGSDIGMNGRLIPNIALRRLGGL